MTRSRAEDLLASPIGLQLLSLIADGSKGALTDVELGELLSQLRFHHSRHLGDYDEYVARLKLRANELAPVAEWLVRRMPSWWSDIDRTDQVWAARERSAPDAARFAVDLGRMHDEAPKPRRALWTSTRTSPSISPWLDHPERADIVHLWRMRVSDLARVAEIHSPEAWSTLAQTYPGTAPGYIFTGVKNRPASARRLDPDWSKVAEEWDAVHLSVGGWLTAEDVPYEANGVWTELRGWEMESTVWFRWCFDRAEPIADPTRDDV